MATINLAKALKEWETKNGIPAVEAKDIRICGGLDLDGKKAFIKQIDASVNTLAEVERLSLSTNQIDRMPSFGGCAKLRLLSLGRNQIKKIEGLAEVGATLEQLWLSYNPIATLDGLSACVKLQVLYMSNCEIKDWNELDKLAGLPELREVLFFGCTMYAGMDKKEAKLQILKRLPRLMKIDNDMVLDSDREAATKL